MLRGAPAFKATLLIAVYCTHQDGVRATAPRSATNWVDPRPELFVYGAQCRNSSRSYYWLREMASIGDTVRFRCEFDGHQDPCTSHFSKQQPDIVVLDTSKSPEHEHNRVLEHLKCFKGPPSILIHNGDESCSLGNLWELYPKFNLVVRQYACGHEYRTQWKVLGSNVIVAPVGYLTGVVGDCLSRKISRSALRGLDTHNPLTKRHLAWSFAGAVKHADRKEAVHKLSKLTPYPNTTIVPRNKVLEMFADSHFVPCLRGKMGLETPRNYEATLAGAIPIVVGSLDELQNTFGYFGENPPWVFAESWSDAQAIVKRLLDDDKTLIALHRRQLVWWLSQLQRLGEAIFHAFNGTSSHLRGHASKKSRAIEYTHQ